MKRARALAAAALLLMAAAPAYAGEAADFRLSQAVQGDRPTTILAYLDVWDATLEPVPDLAASAVSGTLGDRPLTVRGVVPFPKSGEGVGYIFCVDVSKSLSQDAFAQIRSALGRWIHGLRPQDRAAILTFGERSTVLVDYTADGAALRAAIDSLAPTDMLTVFYRGILDALELSSRRDAALPERRVLVVLSDGLDEGSGLAPEDVLIELRERPLPIYAIAYGSKQAGRDLLLRFATNSGGRLVAVAGGDFATAYDQVRAAIDRVWVAELECADCAVDGRVNRLQVNLNLADRVLSKGLDLRLLPALGPAAPEAEPATAAAAAPAAAPAVVLPAPGQDDATGAASSTGPPMWLIAAIVGAVLLAGGAVAALRARARRAALDEATEPAAPARRRHHREKLSWRERRRLDVPFDAAPPVPPLALCLTVVRGAQEGAEHRFLLHERGVVGSGGASDLVVGEPGLAAEQVELVQERGGVYARNLSKKAPTLLNGVPLVDASPLASGDLIGNRDFIARVRLG